MAEQTQFRSFERHGGSSLNRNWLSTTSQPLTTSISTLASVLVEIVDSTSFELVENEPSSMSTNHLDSTASGNEETACTHISEAIAAQGIDDLTSRGYIQALFGLIYGVIFVFGLIGNGGVLIAVAQNKRLRSARNIFLLNLIITDLLLCLTAIPVTPWYALSKEWIFGAVMCRLMPLSTSCAVFVTSWSLTAIAIDKFMHIIDPTREQFSVRLAAFVTILIWLVCSLMNIPYLMSFELVDGSYYSTGSNNSNKICGRFCDEVNWQGEMRRLYGSTVMLFQFVIPLAIITYCYWRILAKVHKDMIIQNVQFCQSLTSSQRIDAIKRKKNELHFDCYGSNFFNGLEQEPEFMRSQPYLWSLLANAIAMSTVVWNPLLFFWLTRKQKRSNLGGILHTSDILTSLASRVHSLRSTGDSLRLGSTRFAIQASSNPNCQSISESNVVQQQMIPTLRAPTRQSSQNR
ncbi:7TM GPCR domain containing protein [Aphelenchoides besseyi]|nr:7TM GPCR domain containing protein [Aphelenchoides besseyi]